MQILPNHAVQFPPRAVMGDDQFRDAIERALRKQRCLRLLVSLVFGRGLQQPLIRATKGDPEIAGLIERRDLYVLEGQRSARETLGMLGLRNEDGLAQALENGDELSRGRRSLLERLEQAGDLAD